MVVFTCNHCGDSLQKPKVEKHYFTKCRRDKSLTCVDCFKDFIGEEYDVHKKCITEAERYSAKGSIPTGIVKKGENKQMQWIEMIESIVETETQIPASQKNIFQILSGNNNVPRKKKPFTNFIQSSTGFKANLTDIENVWNIIEKYKAESLKRRAEENTKENGEKKEETETVEKEEVAAEAKLEDGVKAKKEKKKNKRNSEIVKAEGVEEVEDKHVSIKEEEAVAEEASVGKAKKKKEEIVTEETKVKDEVKTKKEKKKNKRKSEIVKAEDVEEDESSKKNVDKEDVSTKEEEAVAEEASVGKGNKKKEETVIEETKVEDEVKTKKEKKKNKRKSEIVKSEDVEDEPEQKIKKKEDISPKEEEVVGEETSVGKGNKKKKKSKNVKEETKMEVEEQVPKKEKKKKNDVSKVEAVEVSKEVEEESKMEAEEEPVKKNKKEGKSKNVQPKKQVEMLEGKKVAMNSSGGKDEIMEKIWSNEKDLTDPQLKLLKQLAEVGPINPQKKALFKCIRELNGRNTDKLLSKEVWEIIKKYKIAQSNPAETILKNKKKLLKKMKKEKLRKQNGVAQKNGEVNGHEKVANGSVNGEENKVGNKYYSRILDVLNEKNSISLAKLQKKICAKAHETQEEFTPKQLKQFNKTLNKIENVKVEGDRVILST